MSSGYGNQFLRGIRLALILFVLLPGCSQVTMVKTIPTTTIVPTVFTRLSPKVTRLSPATPPVTPGVYFTPSPTHATPSRTPVPASNSLLCSPLKDHTLSDLKEIVTNPFDPPPAGKDSGHHGTDFAYYRRGDRLSIEGVSIQSVLPGKVAATVNNRPPYGNMIIIESPGSDLAEDLVRLLDVQPLQSIYLLYAHMKEKPALTVGQKIDCGEKVGEVGNTPAGWSSAPHLHFEVRLGPSGISFSSLAYYDNGASQEELDNYRRWRMSGDFRMVNPMILLDYGLK